MNPTSELLCQFLVELKFQWPEVHIFKLLQEVLSSYVSTQGTREGENRNTTKLEESQERSNPHLQISLHDQEKTQHVRQCSFSRVAFILA